MLNDLENVGFILLVQTQNDQTGELRWWICTNVSEICLEFHHIVYAGIATTRSRANSAAYVIAACTASRFRDG
jgi:hypothetical protein